MRSANEAIFLQKAASSLALADFVSSLEAASAELNAFVAALPAAAAAWLAAMAAFAARREA